MCAKTHKAYKTNITIPICKFFGYQVTYSLKKNFKKAKSVNVSAKKAKVTLKKLKRGKKYFVKVRAYRNVEGARYYGGYSKTLKVTVR